MGRHNIRSKKSYQKRRKSIQELKKKLLSIADCCNQDHLANSESCESTKSTTEESKSISEKNIHADANSNFNKSSPVLKLKTLSKSNSEKKSTFDYEKDPLYTQWIAYKSLGQKMKQIELTKSF